MVSFVWKSVEWESLPEEKEIVKMMKNHWRGFHGTVFWVQSVLGEGSADQRFHLMAPSELASVTRKRMNETKIGRGEQLKILG